MISTKLILECITLATTSTAAWEPGELSAVEGGMAPTGAYSAVEGGMAPTGAYSAVEGGMAPTGAYSAVSKHSRKSLFF